MRTTRFFGTWSVWACALVALLVMASCGSKYKYDTVKDDPTQTRIYTLQNGLKVYLSPSKDEPRIQTYIAVRTGSKNDPAETTGLAHYLEHLMFKGTDKFSVTDPVAEKPLLDDIEARYENYRKLTDPQERRLAYRAIDSVSQLAAKYFIPNEYDKLMAAIGAEGSNAYTSNDVTCYTEDIPANEIENWAKIQSDRFMNMVIRGFHTELEAVYEEYNIGLASDQQKLYTALMAKLFPNHPYGTQTTIGTQEHLKNPSIINIKNYFNKWYRPNNVAICMAGDFDPDKTIAIIDKYFGAWEAGNDVEQPTFAQQQPLTSPQDTTVLGLEAETLWLGWRFDKANSLQMDTLQVLGQMLSNGVAGLIDLDLTSQMKVLEAWAGVDAMMDHSAFIMAGTPLQGQSLEQVRGLLLEELAKIKAGTFSDDLLPSVINNMKLQYFNLLESNQARADMAVQAFINATPWEQEIRTPDRLASLTKDDIVAFANRHFADNYVAVYKRQGVDPTQKKIDKPEITPIPTNRDTVSQFVKDIQNAKVKPIQPQFVNFKKDLVFGETSQKLPYVYVKNNENGRFELVFRYDFGSESDVRYDYAARFLDYVGTDSLTSEQLKQAFYKLACTYSVQVNRKSISVNLSGLSENMSQALQLLEHLLACAEPQAEAYAQFVALVAKERQDAKLNQRINYRFLCDYGLYGAYNPSRNDLSLAQLQSMSPGELTDLLKTISHFPHTLLYYGPLSEKELAAEVDLCHKVPTTFAQVPAAKPYVFQTTEQNEVWLAPYAAKNIYMRMLHNEQRPWNPDEAALKALFNEYYGGGMNTIVFQELREARGLAYNAYANYVEPDFKGMPEYFFTHIITQNDKMMDCIRQFHVILDTIPESQAAFAIAKESLTKRLASYRASRFGLINTWLQARDLGIDYHLNERIYKALPSLTLADVVRFEKENIASKPYRYLILGDESELDMAALQAIAPVRRISTEELFGY